ncbi:MAG: hypothetical protein B7Y17_04320 [Sulfuricurvum sp. 24-42-5]|nr:MAG: hypothetical protein B7Y17_04320 [Sulfuricurvum sp. 24-42-5]
MNSLINVPVFEEQKVLNKVAPSGSYDFPTIGGIDSLYYFAQSNRAYETFYCDMAITIENKKEMLGGFIPPNSHHITIAEKEFVYYGNKEGFYFFGDGAGWLRIGFKDPFKNQGVQDIRVQLQASGIYLLGLKGLLDYVNNTLLASISNPVYTVTRADLNIFCQYDLGSVIDKEDIITRKQKFVQLFGSKVGYETMYVGKPPFRLRIYDKRAELVGSPKYETMGLYFLEHGINPIKKLWNLEFECHREFLKRYHISSLDDLLENTESLFHRFMKIIRLGDMSTISKKDIEGGRLHRASTHPLWEYLDSSYIFNAYPQNRQPLERLISKPKEYKASDFLKEFRILVAKAEENTLFVHHDDIRKILHESSLWLSPKAKMAVKPYVPIIFETGEARYLLTRNLIPIPTLPPLLSHMSDSDIDLSREALTKALHQELAKVIPDTSLIIKHLTMLEKEYYSRRVGQKELELWQQ